jgi:tetratricopeptide (TPR) repeat protein
MPYRLEKTGFPQLLSACHKQRVSGTLSVMHEGVRKQAYFEDGAIIYAGSDVVSERFGERLRALGKLSAEQFDRAMEALRDGRHLGGCLIDLGFIKESELQPLLANHVAEILYSLFPWRAGEYQFTPQHIHIKGFHQPMPTADIIFEGIRHLPDMNLIRRWLGDFQRRVIPSRDPFMLFQSVTLQPEEAYVISRLDGPLTIAELVTIAGIPEERLLRTLCALLLSGIVEATDTDAPPLAEPVAETMRAVAGGGAIDATAAAQLCFELADIMRVIEENGTHYQVLGVNRRFTADELKKSYRELAKKFHPDRHSQLAAFDFQVKAELERAFIAIQQAYETLNDDAQRRKYDAALQAPKFSTPSGGGVFPPAGFTPPAAPPPVASRALTETPNFSAKHYYLRTIEYLDKGDVERAYQSIRRAVAMKPESSDYQAMLGRTLARLHGHNKEAEKAFLKAVTLCPTPNEGADLLIELADLYHKFGLAQRATEVLHQALTLNPDHLEARLRLAAGSAPKSHS